MNNLMLFHTKKLNASAFIDRLGLFDFFWVSISLNLTNNKIIKWRKKGNVSSDKSQTMFWPGPAVSTSKQMSHTRTGFCRLNLSIEISFSEHFLHKTRPQWRLLNETTSEHNR